MKYRDLEQCLKTKGADKVKVQIFTKLRQHAGLTAAARVLMSEVFARDIDRDGIYWRTPEQLAETLSFDVNTIKRALKELEEKKHLLRDYLVIRGIRSKAKAILLNVNLLMSLVGEDKDSHAEYDRIVKGNEDPPGGENFTPSVGGENLTPEQEEHPSLSLLVRKQEIPSVAVFPKPEKTAPVESSGMDEEAKNKHRDFLKSLGSSAPDSECVDLNRKLFARRERFSGQAAADEDSE